MYFLNSKGTLCHIVDDVRTGKAPDPCGSKANRLDVLRYLEGKPSNLLAMKPSGVPLCKHCEKGASEVNAI